MHFSQGCFIARGVTSAQGSKHHLTSKEASCVHSTCVHSRPRKQAAYHHICTQAASSRVADLLVCKQARKHAVGIDAVTPFACMLAQHEF